MTARLQDTVNVLVPTGALGAGVRQVDVDAGLAASIFHFGQVKIPELKQILKENDILVRL